MKIFQVDSFTDERFKGNPAGVCLVEKFPDADYMQSVAMEMNLSETAFVETSNGCFNIRYFTPVCEVPLCGHATLASAHILYEQALVTDNFIFRAKECDLPISISDGWIKMNFPIYNLTRFERYEKFNEILGVKVLELYKSENDWIVAMVQTEQEVLNAKPDYVAFERENIGLLIALTSISNDLEFDFVVRVFCNPSSGITEDPVTGAANCILIPYWNQKTGKKEFRSKQLSKRTGIIKTALNGNRVDIYGQAITVFTIELSD